MAGRPEAGAPLRDSVAQFASSKSFPLYMDNYYGNLGLCLMAMLFVYLENCKQIFDTGDWSLFPENILDVEV